MYAGLLGLLASAAAPLVRLDSQSALIAAAAFATDDPVDTGSKDGTEFAPPCWFCWRGASVSAAAAAAAAAMVAWAA